MTLEVLDGGLCRYGRDYDVGDVVTALGEGWRMDARLIAMQETWELSLIHICVGKAEGIA